MKVTLIDDLIADTYALFFEANVPPLIEQMNVEESREKMKVDHLMTHDGAADTPTPPHMSGATSDTAVVRHRRGIGRRELQRKAEAIVTKPVLPRLVLKPIKPADDDLSQQLTAPVPLPIKEELREEAQGTQSSVPGSVHDSADDESELSEVDEEKMEDIVRPMFPNLIMTKETSPEPSANVSDNGNGRSPGKGAQSEGEGNVLQTDSKE